MSNFPKYKQNIRALSVEVPVSFPTLQYFNCTFTDSKSFSMMMIIVIVYDGWMAIDPAGISKASDWI